MKVFNGRSATDEYMSTHSLTFSTPEMTLKKFALWLGELVNDPKSKNQVPRLVLYLQDKGEPGKESEVSPDVDDTFRPTGAVTTMYGDVSASDTYSNEEATPPGNGGSQNLRFCIECGSKIKPQSKFCTSCGTKLEY